MSRLPNTDYNAKYPFNKATVTESGHEFHVDDTPGHERIRQAHKSGTYFEISSDGRKVELINGDNYHYVKGGLTLTIDNNGDILIGGNCRLVVKGDVSAEVHGNLNSIVSGDSSSVTMGDLTNVVNGNSITSVQGTSVVKATKHKIKGNVEVDGSVLADDFVANKVSLKSHKHTGVQSGPGLTGTPV